MFNLVINPATGQPMSDEEVKQLEINMLMKSNQLNFSSNFREEDKIENLGFVNMAPTQQELDLMSQYQIQYQDANNVIHDLKTEMPDKTLINNYVDLSCSIELDDTI